ncbi:hypothetical protein ONZ45_g12585 [Pleurotus djamor]|nr:hypothetical protein ONZ45_g12585 [Pleurotus djamor]
MPGPDAQIRKFQQNDTRLAQFIISKANLGQLAVANRMAFTHWLTMGIWFALSSVFVQIMNWWPSGPWYTYLMPVPALACIALPLLYYIDWNNRPYFEKEAEIVMKGADLTNIEEYYSESKASSFWILEMGDRFIGLIAVDASQGSSKETTRSKATKDGGKPRTATIRHFYVDEPYRPTGIQTDLLEHAVKSAFTNDAKLERIEVVTSPLVSYCDESYKALGFEKEKELQRVGVLRWKVELLSLTRQAWQAPRQGPIEVIIDSLDTLVSDTGSNAETYKSLNKLMTIINARPRPSRLIVHANAPSNLLSMLTQVQFSPSLTHVMAHPPTILTHLASAYLTPPPPLSPDAKFWSVFLPFSLRRYETDNLVYGPDGEGSGGLDEMVVEILSRSGSTSRRRGVERALEGWNLLKNMPQGLNELSFLRTLFTPQKSIEIAPDPTQNVSFNLNLTPSQQVSRAQVPLPYAHVGENTSQKAAIFYDPDSADDMDDDDPDEDLDI